MAERLITPQDFTTGAPPRIMGTEAEDHVNLYNCSEEIASDISKKRTEEHYAMFKMLSPNTCQKIGITVDNDLNWKSNGQMIYIDSVMDEHYLTSYLVESCTAEQLGPKKALAGTMAAIKVAQKLADASEQDIQIFRRSATIDAKGNVEKAGFHMNHITTEAVAKCVTNYELTALNTHSITRLYTWEGMVAPEGFTLSQKANGFPDALFYRAKDKEYGFQRLEDYSGDDASPWGTFMAMATTSVLLRVLEHPEEKDLNKRLNRLTVVDPFLAIKRVSSDTTLRERIALEDGRKLTAIQIQTELADIASEFSKRFTLPEDEQYAIDEWQKVCRDLMEGTKTKDLFPLIDRIGWVGKKHVLEKMVGKSLDPSDARAVYLDMQWDSYYPKEGGRLLLPQKTGVTVVTDAEVDPLVYNPPLDTRAVVRNSYLEDKNLKVVGVDWGKVEIEYLGGKKKILLHPYQTER